MADGSLSQNTNIDKGEEKNSNEDNYDTPDGFRKYIAKKFKKYSCASGMNETDSAKDFTENKPRERPDPKASGQSESNMATNLLEDKYNFGHKNRGLAVIINNEDFSRSKEFGDRPGSSCDASSLYHSFTALGFEVMLFHDLPTWKMIEVLQAAVKQYDHANADCFVCSILSHGDETWSDKEWDRMGTTVRLDLLFGTDGKALTTKAIVEMFNDKNCPGLKDKPRLFFLQACRGDKYDDGQAVLVKRPVKDSPIQSRGRGDNKDGRDGGSDVTDTTDKSPQKKTPPPPPPAPARQTSLSSSVDPPQYHQPPTPPPQDTTDAAAGGSDSEDESDEETTGGKGGSDKTDAIWHRTRDVPVSPAPLYQDALIMYATPPGHYAWRRRTGAWFIQCLCKLFDSNVLEHVSLVRGLSYVCGKVAREYQSENPSNPVMHHKKEVPVIESMLIKDVFFNKKAATVPSRR